MNRLLYLVVFNSGDVVGTNDYEHWSLDGDVACIIDIEEKRYRASGEDWMSIDLEVR